MKLNASESRVIFIMYVFGSIRNFFVRVNTPRNIQILQSLTYKRCVNYSVNNYQVCCKHLSTNFQTILFDKRPVVMLPHSQCRNSSSIKNKEPVPAPLMDSTKFQAACSKTLESLADSIEQLIEETPFLVSADVLYGVQYSKSTIHFRDPE